MASIVCRTSQPSIDFPRYSENRPDQQRRLPQEDSIVRRVGNCERLTLQSEAVRKPQCRRPLSRIWPFPGGSKICLAEHQVRVPIFLRQSAPPENPMVACIGDIQHFPVSGDRMRPSKRPGADRTAAILIFGVLPEWRELSERNPFAGTQTKTQKTRFGGLSTYVCSARRRRPQPPPTLDRSELTLTAVIGGRKTGCLALRSPFPHPPE